MMKRFSIIVAPQAKEDAGAFYNCIRYQYKQLQTANRNMRELYKTIASLSYRAHAVGANEYVQAMFGFNARHVTSGKMAIIYFIEGDTVYIRRILPASLIR